MFFDFSVITKKKPQKPQEQQKLHPQDTTKVRFILRFVSNNF